MIWVKPTSRIVGQKYWIGNKILHVHHKWFCEFVNILRPWQGCNFVCFRGKPNPKLASIVEVSISMKIYFLFVHDDFKMITIRIIGNKVIVKKIKYIFWCKHDFCHLKQSRLFMHLFLYCAFSCASSTD